MDLDTRRRFFAEEIEAVARLRTTALVDALAAVPRERFLPPGPWTVVAEVLLGGGPSKGRLTPDADPARVYHNIGVALDPGRQLFNGQPATLTSWIDALALAPGARVLHVGCGMGYYTAVMAHVVGPSGCVLAYDVDEDLTAAARDRLAERPWVEVRAAADADPHDATYDAILINAGVTHPLPSWLDALAPGGRMIVPLTVTMGSEGRIGKGVVASLAREQNGTFGARIIGMVMIYSAAGIRDESLSAALGKAMMAGPLKWAAVTQLRSDPHEPTSSCWYHTDTFCLSE